MYVGFKTDGPFNTEIDYSGEHVAITIMEFEGLSMTAQVDPCELEEMVHYLKRCIEERDRRIDEGE